MLKFLAVPFAATVLALTPVVCWAEDVKLARTIAISGHGEIHAAPDVASLSLGVTNNAATAKEAVEANTKAMKALLDQMKAVGIADKDIQTSNFIVSPRYDYRNESNQQPQASGYDASNAVTVTVRKLDELGSILDQAVTAGANQINGITFGLADPEPAVDKARLAAVADAKRKAELYVTASGVALGQVISISEGGSYQPPTPMFAVKAASESAADVPIAQGEQVIAADVSVVWEIK